MCYGLTAPLLAPLPLTAPPMILMCDPQPPLPRRMRRMAAALRACGDTRERLLRLARLSERLPAAPVLELGERTRVPGCTSVAHVLAHFDTDGAICASGAADSKLARGMLALLVRGVQGESEDVLSALSSAAIAEAAGLPGALSSSRLVGLDNMLALMRTQLASPRAADASAEAMDARSGTATDSARDSAAAASAADPVWEAAQTGSWAAAEEEVAVLLSGGVDSSVALRLLHDAGARCRAFYLRIWLEDEQSHVAKGECPWEEDWEYASAVCAQVGIPLEPVSLQREYSDKVVEYLVSEAAAGRTPNPDIMCNTRIKFGAFYDRVGRHFGAVASGHYARTAPLGAVEGEGVLARPEQVQLLTSADDHKDQTYFLSQLSQEQLRHARFPIGHLPKQEVRTLAERMQLPNRARKDSQGICFLGQLNYEEFLEAHLGERRGTVLDFESGEQIGEHRGLWFHTVGQRRGLGPTLSSKHVARGPWYVVRKDIPANILYASRQYWTEDKSRNAFRAESINWVAGCAPAAAASGEPIALRVKVRHGVATHEASVRLVEGGSAAQVELHGRDKGLAPGQFAAFYDGDVCLGSGVISEAGL